MVLRRLLRALVVSGLLLALADSARAAWEVVNGAADGLPSIQNPFVKDCDPEVWHQDRVLERGEPIKGAVCGDLRGDGVERMYAYLGKTNALVELENSKEGPHAVNDLFQRKAFAPVFGIGPGRTPGKPSIFVSAGVSIAEVYRDGDAWKWAYIDANIGRGCEAVVAYDLRQEGRVRFYALAYELLLEYTLSGGQWKKEVFSIHPGNKYSKNVTVSLVQLKDNRSAMSVVKDYGAELVSWSGRRGLALGPVRTEPGVPDPGFRANVEHVLNKGQYCFALSSGAFSTALAESADNSGSALSRRLAAAKRLNAKYYGEGMTGTFNGSSFATFSLIDIEDGRHLQPIGVVWKSTEALAQRAEEVARRLCSGGSR